MPIRKTFRQVRNKIVQMVLDQPLPPLETEQVDRLRRLQAAIAALPPIDLSAGSEAERAWAGNRSLLRQTILTCEDPTDFIRWDVTQSALFVGNSFYIALELLVLRLSRKWKSLWRHAIVESRVGAPTPFFLAPSSSGNLIHQVYHIKRFEDTVGMSIQEPELILEFGGGYGSLCRLVRSLGFKGEYIIYDLPEISLLQRYYLESVGAQAVYVSDLEGLQSELNKHEKRKSLFIATWSLSETSLDLRSRLLGYVNEFSWFLLAYYHRYREVDNVEFFRRWADTLPRVEWLRPAIRNRRGDHYLFGRPKGTQLAPEHTPRRPPVSGKR